MNWEEACQVIGVQSNASTSEIRAQYLYKAQLLHPDKNANSPLHVQQKAEEELKKVNAAYDFLRNPHNKPNTTPPRLEVKPTHIRFNLDLNQKKVTTIRINSVGGLFTRFWMDDSPAPWLKVTEVKSLTKDPLPMEVTLEATGIEISGGNTDCQLPIRVENENTHDVFETKTRIELKVNPSSVSPDAPQVVPRTAVPNTGKFPRWLKAVLLLFALAAIGIAASLYLKTFIPLWVFLGFSLVFSIQTWFYDFIVKYKVLGFIYRLLLNLSILALLGVLIWSGTRLFSQKLGPTPLVGSIFFFVEFFAFVWLWIIISKNKSRRPSMKLTVLFLVFAFIVLAFAGVEPFMGYKDSILSVFSK